MIKTISFVFMILWSFSASLKAQLKSDYCISLAFSLMDIKQNELADSLFDKAFLIGNQGGFSARVYLGRAELKSLLLDSISSIYYLEQSIENGIKKESIQRKIRKGNLMFSKAWSIVLDKKYDSLYYKYESRVSKSEIQFIEQLNYLDQSIRKLYYSINMINPKDSILECIKVVNDRNTAFVAEQFFNRYSINFPKMSEIGYNSVDNLANILLHIGVEVDTSFFQIEKIICDAIETKGFISKYYANIVDFHRFSKGQGELYGTEMFNEKEGIKTYRLIFDIKNVDLRRKEVGLEPLYFHAKFWGAELPEGYSFDLEKFLADLRKEITN